MSPLLPTGECPLGSLFPLFLPRAPQPVPGLLVLPVLQPWSFFSDYISLSLCFWNAVSRSATVPRCHPASLTWLPPVSLPFFKLWHFLKLCLAHASLPPWSVLSNVQLQPWRDLCWEPNHELFSPTLHVWGQTDQFLLPTRHACCPPPSLWTATRHLPPVFLSVALSCARSLSGVLSVPALPSVLIGWLWVRSSIIVCLCDLRAPVFCPSVVPLLLLSRLLPPKLHF